MDKTMKAMDELVNGEDGWRDVGDCEMKEVVSGKAWFKRCCGQRMLIIQRCYRSHGASGYPPESRGSKRWWGPRIGYKCGKCNYFQLAPTRA